MPRFHHDTLRRLGVEYAADPASMRALNERAAGLGITLPASFVEWYGMYDGIDLLRQHSNCDEPIAIDELGKPCAWRWRVERDLVREGLLLFMVENQAVCVWALRLDGEGDPPVVVARDPDLEWRACVDRFSSFVECQVWDHTEIWNEAERILLQAQAGPLQSADLARLRESFRERTTTHGWPGDNQYRFERDGSRVLVWDGEDQADWWLSGTTEDAIAELARDLWTCGDLQTSLWSNDDVGEAVLRRLRNRP